MCKGPGQKCLVCSQNSKEVAWDTEEKQDPGHDGLVKHRVNMRVESRLSGRMSSPIIQRLPQLLRTWLGAPIQTHLFSILQLQGPRTWHL